MFKLKMLLVDFKSMKKFALLVLVLTHHVEIYFSFPVYTLDLNF